MLYPRATPSISDNFQVQSSTCVGGWAFFGLIKYRRVFHPVPRKMSRTLPPRQSATLSPPSKLFSKQSAPTLPKISDLKKLKKMLVSVSTLFVPLSICALLQRGNHAVASVSAGLRDRLVSTCTPKVLPRHIFLASGRATDAKDRHLGHRHQRVKVPSRYPQGNLKLSSSPQVLKYTKGMS